MPPNKYSLEVCIDTAAGLSACTGLVDRVELCSALDLGGLTPCTGLMRAARQSSLCTHVMIRPRAGDFCYDSDDLQVMQDCIHSVREIGLAGVVLGASKGDGLDLEALQGLAAAADGLDLTLHRVIDLLPDPLRAMEQAIDLGFHRILTSGGAPKAQGGLTQITALQKAANGRIEIMAGSGISVSNIAQIAQKTGVKAFHSSCSLRHPVPEPLHRFGFAQTSAVTDRATVAALRERLDTLPS
ncbi:copper homeostasis protein CutC [Shimia sp. R11_0]|uniref:copper homeostasis protein CutC n=1 Tax=Shimia sp. R11_0 TaxID=2821096 RepID=UPI001ADA95BB|nr:copper homeostasis protein CutC [Shimia sp. R11_0]MBO9476207.1 copper homeostasis protein CutC [Shimia sp. R11_0]